MKGLRESDKAAKYLLFALLAVIVLVFPVRMLMGARGEAQDRIAEVEAELTAARAQLALADQVLADPVESRDLVEVYGEALPPAVDLAGILDDFATAAAASGVRFISVAPDEDALGASSATSESPEVTDVEITSAPGGGLQIVTLQLSVQGAPSSFAAFLDSLRDLDRLYVVVPQSFTWGTQASPDFFIATLLVYTYVWPEDVTVLEQAQSLVDAEATTSRSTTSSTPSSAPTGTSSGSLPDGVVIEPVVAGEQCGGLGGADGRTADGRALVCAVVDGVETWSEP